MSDSEGDEAPDYSTLLQRSKHGQKENVYDPSQENSLEESRNALFAVIDERKKVNEKNLSLGTLDRVTGLTSVSRYKGTHFRVMGHTVKGCMMLYPEEAAWLINMSALRIESDDDDDDDDTTGLEDYFEFMFAQKDGWITFEKYQVYAYLRRLGYIVRRSTLPLQQQQQQQYPSPSLLVGSYWSHQCGWLIRTVAYCVKRVLLYCFGSRPLVRRHQSSTLHSVYSTLKIVPSSPWYKPFTTDQNTCRVTDTSFDWDVYRPNPQWKKRDPGVPDFRVVVTNSCDAIPSLAKYQKLFSDLEKSPRHSDSFHHIRYTNTLNLSFLLAVVDDAGAVSFLRISGDGVVDLSSSSTTTTTTGS
ncbi:hypothetical protein BDB00DRAFT_134588 [Zychaea mexicana]|uniref:uncharacterized protein n=1 Tax=Zychaea mexicana TaxID=64656 RepID=UPI0022FEDF48|nr:uncharacterized protein BDB00DRAFT_134588 [Zychaea mexicana]KAI9484466.1 hypothetical protein BDB00DRAFT_134588 [Zychaea mexicana]